MLFLALCLVVLSKLIRWIVIDVLAHTHAHVYARIYTCMHTVIIKHMLQLLGSSLLWYFYFCYSTWSTGASLCRTELCTTSL